MNARLIKAAARENAASAALNHQEQPAFCRPDQTESASLKTKKAARRSRRHAHPPGFEAAHSAEKREKSRRGKSKSAAAPFPASHSRKRRANALQAPFREKRSRQSWQMRNRAAGFQRPLPCAASEAAHSAAKNAKRAAAENPSPQQPLFLLPTAETAGRMRFKRLSGKSARARDGRCETEQPVFSARYRVRRGAAERSGLSNSSTSRPIQPAF